MTTPEMWETFRAIDAAAAAVPGALVRHTARRDLGRVDVSVTSASGGNVAVRGVRGDRPWRIGIRNPRVTEDSPLLLAALDTHDESVNTHGDDQRFFDYEGRRYSHILDPLTGAPAQGLRSLTVVHKDGTLAEAGGAALFVAGEQGWPALARQLGITQVMVVTDDGRVLATPSLAARLRMQTGVELQVVG